MTGSLSLGACPACGARSGDNTCPRCGHSIKTEEQATANSLITDDVTPPQVAIIGTEGSGKTVLITILGKRFSRVAEDGVFLEPLDNKTLKYVESIWQILNDGEWPESTPVGKLFELRWRLHCGCDSPMTCDLRLADSAGQDLRRLFSDDDADAIEQLPAHLQRLAEYCRAADIVVCLVNLRDFVGAADPSRRIDNQAVIMSALRRLSSDASRVRRLYLLFTQIDLYKGYRKKYGGWPGVLKEFLPYVHGARVAREKVTVGAVAAVANTVPAQDGTPRRVPAPHFESRGLEDVMSMIVKDATEIVVARRDGMQRQRELERQRIETAEQLAIHDEAERKRTENRRAMRLPLRIGAVGIVVLLLWWITLPPLPKAVFVPIPTPSRAWDVTYGTFFDDVWLKNTSEFKLNDVRFTVDVYSNGRFKVTKELRCGALSPGERHTWSNELSIPKDSHHGSRVKLDFAPFLVSCGIEYGRMWDELWVQNDGPSAASNVSLTVVVTRAGKHVKNVALQTARLQPGEKHFERVRISGGDELSATLNSWQ